jgi:hypothetical protein
MKMSYAEDRQWSDRFGESYLDQDTPDEELDDDQIDRLEEEFFRDADNPEGHRSAWGNLDEVDGPDTSGPDTTP